MIGDEYQDIRDPRRRWTLLIEDAMHGGVRSVCLTATEGPVVTNKWVSRSEFLEFYRKT